MTARARFVSVALLAGMAFTAGRLAGAQLDQLDPLPEPRVLSGADMGFRVEGALRGVPAGRIVIRVNGEWVEPKLTPGPVAVRPLR